MVSMHEAPSRSETASASMGRSVMSGSVGLYAGDQGQPAAITSISTSQLLAGQSPSVALRVTISNGGDQRSGGPDRRPSRHSGRRRRYRGGGR
jgi:hypothetical protein